MNCWPIGFMNCCAQHTNTVAGGPNHIARPGSRSGKKENGNGQRVGGGGTEKESDWDWSQKEDLVEIQPSKTI